MTWPGPVLSSPLLSPSCLPQFTAATVICVPLPINCMSWGKNNALIPCLATSMCCCSLYDGSRGWAPPPSSFYPGAPVAIGGTQTNAPPSYHVLFNKLVQCHQFCLWLFGFLWLWLWKLQFSTRLIENILSNSIQLQLFIFSFFTINLFHIFV